MVLGLCSKVLGAEGGLGPQGWEAARSCPYFPISLPEEPTPASSRMDPLLAKAKPSSNSGSPSGLTYFRRKRKKIIAQK